MSHKSGGTNTNKDVIYIDVDDEITGIIDKVRGSSKKIVALVLPKRATVLQSVVNMKLLKRASTEAKKSLVLITSESGLLPLAGSVGIHVAKSLSSKPEIPDAPERINEKTETIDAGEDEPDNRLDASKTVGELSGELPAVGDTDETIELDDDDVPAIDDAGNTKPAKARYKKFRIPDFNKFRLLLVLGAAGIVVLSVVGYAAVAVWPRAVVTIKTDSEAVNSSLTLSLKTGETQLDVEKAIIQAQKQEVKKTLTQEAPATGQINNGEKATGTVTMTGKDCVNPFSKAKVSDVPAGTGITANGKTYITQKKANFGSFSFDPGSGCFVSNANNIDIVAQTGGAGFNVASATFTVGGRSDVTATGSASGGTDSIIKVVSQADIDGAKQKITEQDTKPIRQELTSALVGRGLFAMDVTFGVGAPETKLSVEANSPADAVTVTQTITYTMFGVKQDDLEKIIKHDIEKKIDAKKQGILSYGLDDAFLSIQGLGAEDATVAIQATVIAGPELQVETLKKQIAGKKASDAKESISANPGVTDVTVKYSPFWVSAIPKKASKITIVIQEPEARSDATPSP